MFVVPCLLLFALLVPSSVLAGNIIPVSPSKFTDPYSNNDALLDMFLPTTCVKDLTIQVKFPSAQGQGASEANAEFQGPAFAKTINGKSITNGQPAVDVSAFVVWDPVANTLTFSDFSTGSWAPWNNNPGYINVNFDIPSANFQDPGAPDFVTYPGTGYPVYNDNNADHVPLRLNRLNPPDTAPLFIDLHNVNDFNVNQDGQCGPSGPHGDPVFAGFQGQEFQFHGLPDEHFNLVSSPDLQLNSHFVYLSAGKCDYNDTECYTHPGTYMDVLGFQLAEAHIKIVAGTHDQGLRVWVNDVEITRGTYIKQVSTNLTTASLKYHKNGKVQIMTDIMGFEVVNSDMFMNIRTSLNNPQLLRIGATKHTVTDALICKTNGETHNYQLVETTVAKKYPVTTPLHGLMGQTWRNVRVCGRDWMGTVQDYLVSDLFANDNHYNYFKW